jgi:hypothetical protein
MLVGIADSGRYGCGTLDGRWLRRTLDFRSGSSTSVKDGQAFLAQAARKQTLASFREVESSRQAGPKFKLRHYSTPRRIAHKLGAR